MSIVEKVVERATRVRSGFGRSSFGQDPAYEFNRAVVRIVLLGMLAGAILLLWWFRS